MEKTFSAPLAIIKIDGVAVGKMKNVRLTENIRRAKVTGIGRLNPEELAAVEWSGTLSCSAYTINFNKLLNSSNKGTFRGLGNVEAWANALLFHEGITIEVIQKVKTGNPDPVTGQVTTEQKTFAVVKNAFATRESFDLQEGQLSGRDSEFEYLEPVLFSE